MHPNERGVLAIVLLVLLALNLFPLYVMLSISVKGEGSVLTSLADLVPERMVLTNYVEVLSRGPFARYFLNSTVVVTFVVGGNVIFASIFDGYPIFFYNIIDGEILREDNECATMQLISDVKY